MATETHTNETLPPEKTGALALTGPIPAGHRGVELRTLNDYYRFAQFVVAANMLPPGILNEAGVVIALQRGAEVGLLPMQALQSIYVVNNSPHLYGDAPKAIVEASGLMEDCKEFEEGTYPQKDYKWVCIVKRRGRSKRRSEFSIADAETAQLWGKKSKEGKPSPWVLYPKRMLMWRARGYALRDEFPDVLKGFPIRELVDEFDGAKPAVGQVIEPASPASSPPPSSKAEPPRSNLGPQKNLFDNLESEPPKEPESPFVDQPQSILQRVRIRLAENPEHTEADLLELLKRVELVGAEVEKLEAAPEEALKTALADWDNVVWTLEKKAK
jgi:hypothetical protein